MMTTRLAALVVDESKWLAVSMGLAALVTAALLYRYRRVDTPTRNRVLGAMNLFFGVTLGTMALGHFLAVSTKLATGTLRGSALVLYPIGVAVALPAWWLALRARALLASKEALERGTQLLNAWLGLTLLAFGVLYLPLALPALFNIAYARHTHRAAGRTIVGAAVAFSLALFIGSLIFLASGQSFEQFTGVGAREP